MEYNKLNVFHWHIVDDHSFPYESHAFPELSESGAYRKDMTYSRTVVNEIIAYAKARGIRLNAFCSYNFYNNNKHYITIRRIIWMLQSDCGI